MKGVSNYTSNYTMKRVQLYKIRLKTDEGRKDDNGKKSD